MAATVNIDGVSRDNTPSGTYIDVRGQVQTIVNRFVDDANMDRAYDGATNSTQSLVISGTGTAGATLTLTDARTNINGTPGGTTSVNVLVDQSGRWSYTLNTSGAFPEGEHRFTATLTDTRDGTTASDIFDELVVRSTFANLEPDAPALSAIADAQDINGTASPNLIARSGLTFAGTSDAYALIRVFLGTSPGGGGGQIALTVQADSNGYWTTAEDPQVGNLLGQTYYVQVNATDIAGNSTNNAATAYRVDAIAPTETLTTVSYTDTSGGAKVTRSGAVTVSGAVSDDFTVDSVDVFALTNGGAVQSLGRATITNGGWSITSTVTADGLKSFYAIATDEVGNTTRADSTAGMNFTLDTTAPVETNTSQTFQDDNATAAGLTNDNAIVVRGTFTDADQVRTVEIFDGSRDVGPATLSNGTFSLSTVLADGTHTLRAVVTDRAGNSATGANFATLVVDTVDPTASISDAYSDGRAGPVAGLTNDPNITVTVNAADLGGTGVATVSIYEDVANSPTDILLGNATFDSVSGTYKLAFNGTTNTLAQGAHNLYAHVIDNVGNDFDTANLPTFTLDTIAPGVPTVVLRSDTGFSTGDLYTAVGDVRGTAEAGSLVSIFGIGSNALVGTATADANGLWSLALPSLGQGLNGVYADATDAAGNISADSADLRFTYDTVRPTVAITFANGSPTPLTATSNSVGLVFTFSEAPKDAAGNALALTGPNAANFFTVTGGTLTNFAQTNAVTFTATFTDTAQSNTISDTVTFKATQDFDQAGNANLVSNTLTVAGDTLRPAAPQIVDVDTASDGNGNTAQTTAVVSGITEANATIRIYDTERNDERFYPANQGGNPVFSPGNNRTLVGTGTADANGNFSIVVTPLSSDETHDLFATATDSVGNLSADGALVTAAVLSPSDTYSAAAVLGRSGGSAQGLTPYFIVGGGDDSFGDGSSVINGGRVAIETIHDEYSSNSTITVGSTLGSIVHGGAGAAITAGSGVNVFVIDGFSGGATASPIENEQSIHQLKQGDLIDISDVFGANSVISIARTAAGDVLTIDNGFAGAGGTRIKADGVNITYEQLITDGEVRFVAPDNSAMVGGSDDDVFVILGGSHSINGGAGDDAIRLSGLSEQYNDNLIGGAGTLSGGSLRDGGAMTVTGIEELVFSDGILSFDQDGSAAQVYRLFDTVLDHTPGLNLGVYVEALETNTLTLLGVAASLLGTAEGQADTGSLSNAAFVDYLYDSAFGRDGDAGGSAFWIGQLNSNAQTRAQVAVAFSESGEHIAGTAGVVNAGIFVVNEEYAEASFFYDAAFDRAPDVGGLNFWAHNLQGGLSETSLGDAFVNSSEFKANTAGLSTSQMVDYIYANAMERPIDAASKQAYTDQMNQGASLGSILSQIALSGEHQALQVSTVDHGVQLFVA